MTDTLTAKYRPTRFQDMVGQKLTAVVLSQMVAQSSVPQALLFAGPRGTGKTTAARILAMELNPDARDSILAGTSLAVLEIDAASHGSVADIRALVEQLRYHVGAENRVVILDEAHSITREGFNALLKTLEEPPAEVTFVLVTTEPTKLPPTVLSRLTEFEFRRVAPVDILSRIIYVAQEEGISISPELETKLAESAAGDVRSAIQSLDYVRRAHVETVEQYVELTGEKDVGPLLFASLLTGDHGKIFSVFDRLMLETGDPRVLTDALNNVITDLFILQAEGDVAAAGTALENRLKLSRAVSSEELYSAVRILWDMKTRLRPTDDQRSFLAAALILISQKVGAVREAKLVIPDKPAIPPVASEVEARPLTLSEIQQS